MKTRLIQSLVLLLTAWMVGCFPYAYKQHAPSLAPELTDLTRQLELTGTDEILLLAFYRGSGFASQYSLGKPIVFKVGEERALNLMGGEAGIGFYVPPAIVGALGSGRFLERVYLITSRGCAATLSLQGQKDKKSREEWKLESAGNISAHCRDSLVSIFSSSRVYDFRQAPEECFCRIGLRGVVIGWSRQERNRAVDFLKQVRVPHPNEQP